MDFRTHTEILLTNWSHWVERREKTPWSQTSTNSTIPSACPSSYGAVQRFTSQLLRSFFLFFLHRNENCEQCKLSTSDLPQHKNVERLVCHRGTRRVDTILFSGFELLWLTLLAGWLTVWLADDATETGFKCNMFAERNSLTFQEILRSVPLSCPPVKATASSCLA